MLWVLNVVIAIAAAGLVASMGAPSWAAACIGLMVYEAENLRDAVSDGRK